MPKDNLSVSLPEKMRSLIERDLLADKPFDQIVAPIREDFRKAGVTEAQLDQIVDRARKATFTRRRKAA